MNLLQQILQSKALERTKRFVGKQSGLYLKLKRFTPSASEEMRTAMLCKHMGITHVVDIGANTGQFAESLYDFGFSGKVVSFEPVAAAREELEKRSAPYPNWTIAERCAIGAEDGTITMNVSDDTVFSSALPIKDSYVSHNQKSRIVRQEEVPVFRIDTILPRYIKDPGNAHFLFKIDTQGFEKQVIDGGPDTLAQAKGLKIEIPLYAIYDNTEFQFYDIMNLARHHGFRPYSFHIEGVDLNTGRVNTIDGLFFRED